MRLALRRLAQAPGFTAICLLTLALGIGGNTAVFTLIDAVLLKPLPVPRPSELHRLGDTDDCCVNSGLPGSFSLFSYDLYTHLRNAAPEFTSLAAFQANVRAMTIGRPTSAAPADTVNAAFVSGNYFQMFELTPAAGRLVQPSDDRPGSAPVAVLSYRAWTQRFQRRPEIVGARLLLNGAPVTMVGIAPEGFYGDTLRPNPAEIWVPLAQEPLLQPAARLLESRGSHWLYIIGRLATGTPVAPIQARLTTAVQQWVGTLDLSPDDRKQIPRQHITITSAAGGIQSMREDVAPALKLLQAVAGAVLLIACANLASLLLARGLGRRTETAVRAALGASRGRLVADSLAESALLACAGGAAGLLVAYGAARAIVGVAFRGASDIPVDSSPSLLAMGFAVAVSLVTGATFGVVPALVGSRSNPIDAMRGAGRVTGERGSGIRRSLIALQVALSLVLITSAGLLGRSLQKLETQDFGFRSDGRYVAALAPSLSTIPQDQLESLYARIRERLLRVPGVVNVSYSLYSPMSGDNWASLITVDGHDTTERLVASWNRVGPRYFDTIGTPIVRGRAIDQRDGAGSPLVAVVSQAFARKFFGGTDPVGRRIGFTNTMGTGARSFEIVGVVGDAKYQDARMPPYATFFLPFLQQTPVNGTLGGGSERLDRSHYPGAIELQTAAAPPGLDQGLRNALAEVDPRITVRTVMSMDEQVARRFNVERLVSRLTVAFGLGALLLACLGLYGVTSQWVTRRTREIGIRMAVGASRARVLRTVLRGAMVQLALGIGIGLPASFAAGRLLQAQLYGLSGHDPLVLSGALAVLALSSLGAAVIPASRAAGVDPVTALRSE